MKKFSYFCMICLLLEITGCSVSSAASLDEMKTPAEESNYTRTSSSQEVIDFCTAVAKQSNGRIRVQNIGDAFLIQENLIDVKPHIYHEQPFIQVQPEDLII